MLLGKRLRLLSVLHPGEGNHWLQALCCQVRFLTIWESVFHKIRGEKAINPLVSRIKQVAASKHAMLLLEDTLHAHLIAPARSFAGEIIPMDSWALGVRTMSGLQLSRWGQT